MQQKIVVFLPLSPFPWLAEEVELFSLELPSTCLGQSQQQCIETRTKLKLEWKKTIGKIFGDISTLIIYFDYFLPFLLGEAGLLHSGLSPALLTLLWAR